MLELTVSEVLHVRLICTQAELEAAGGPKNDSRAVHIRELLRDRRLCFYCKSTRLDSWFGPKSCICILCSKTVCSKCIKMV